MSTKTICKLRGFLPLPILLAGSLLLTAQNKQDTLPGVTTVKETNVLLTAGKGHRVDSSGSIAERIAHIENGLLPSSIIGGKPIPNMKLTERMRFYGTPGVSIAVINNYNIEWIKHYGVKDKEQSTAVDDRTIFQAGSISKPLTALLIMKLVQGGKLDLDKNINTYLKSWKVPENDFTKDSAVTIRKILNHTAGFAPADLSGFHPDSIAPSLLQVLNGTSPAHNPPVVVTYIPGTKMDYTGSGFIILQQLLIDLFKKPFSEIMEKNIFLPLGMTSSTFENPVRKTNLHANAATGYQRGVRFDSKNYTKPMQASGGLWSNVRDLALLSIEIQRSLLGSSNKILKKDIVQLMLQPPADAHKGFALGFMVNAQNGFMRFGHGGYTDGFRSDLIGFSNGQGLVVLTNGNSQGILREITRAVAVEYNWPEKEFYPIQRKLVQVPADTLQQYTGSYEFPVGRNPRVSTVQLKDGKLFIDEVELFPESESRFFGLGESTLTFNKNASGQVIGLWLDYPELRLTAQKLE